MDFLFWRITQIAIVILGALTSSALLWRLALPPGFWDKLLLFCAFGSAFYAFAMVLLSGLSGKEERSSRDRQFTVALIGFAVLYPVLNLVVRLLGWI